MIRSILSLFVVATLAACGGADTGTPAAEASSVPRTEQEVVVSGTPVTLADLSVEGMTCEMMCGGAIKKALAKLPGVEATEIKFAEGEATDHAIITYDPAKVSDAELVKAVEGIHDGQYKVSAVNVTRQVQGEAPVLAPAGDEAAEAEKDEVSAVLPTLELPNLLGFLSRLLRM
ncbi:MAG: heavy-metal-associated domain-containing protein [Flavobacteriales bacterium]|nr:heavy-metal-associated domain-containing protein [Flavobacteriales bacterium]